MMSRTRPERRPLSSRPEPRILDSSDDDDEKIKYDRVERKQKNSNVRGNQMNGRLKNSNYSSSDDDNNADRVFLGKNNPFDSDEGSFGSFSKHYDNDEAFNAIGDGTNRNDDVSNNKTPLRVNEEEVYEKKRILADEKIKRFKELASSSPKKSTIGTATSSRPSPHSLIHQSPVQNNVIIDQSHNSNGSRHQGQQNDLLRKKLRPWEGSENEGNGSNHLPTSNVGGSPSTNDVLEEIPSRVRTQQSPVRKQTLKPVPRLDCDDDNEVDSLAGGVSLGETQQEYSNRVNDDEHIHGIEVSVPNADLPRITNTLSNDSTEAYEKGSNINGRKKSNNAVEKNLVMTSSDKLEETRNIVSKSSGHDIVKKEQNGSPVQNKTQTKSNIFLEKAKQIKSLNPSSTQAMQPSKQVETASRTEQQEQMLNLLKNRTRKKLGVDPIQTKTLNSAVDNNTKSDTIKNTITNNAPESTKLEFSTKSPSSNTISPANGYSKKGAAVALNHESMTLSSEVEYTDGTERSRNDHSFQNALKPQLDTTVLSSSGEKIKMDKKEEQRHVHEPISPNQQQKFDLSPNHVPNSSVRTSTVRSIRNNARSSVAERARQFEINNNGKKSLPISFSPRKESIGVQQSLKTSTTEVSGYSPGTSSSVTNSTQVESDVGRLSVGSKAKLFQNRNDAFVSTPPSKLKEKISPKQAIDTTNKANIASSPAAISTLPSVPLTQQEQSVGLSEQAMIDSQSKLKSNNEITSPGTKMKRDKVTGLQDTRSTNRNGNESSQDPKNFDENGSKIVPKGNGKSADPISPSPRKSATTQIHTNETKAGTDASKAQVNQIGNKVSNDKKEEENDIQRSNDITTRKSAVTSVVNKIEDSNSGKESRTKFPVEEPQKTTNLQIDQCSSKSKLQEDNHLNEIIDMSTSHNDDDIGFMPKFSPRHLNGNEDDDSVENSTNAPSGSVDNSNCSLDSDDDDVGPNIMNDKRIRVMQSKSKKHTDDRRETSESPKNDVNLFEEKKHDDSMILSTSLAGTHDDDKYTLIDNESKSVIKIKVEGISDDEDEHDDKSFGCSETSSDSEYDAIAAFDQYLMSMQVKRTTQQEASPQHLENKSNDTDDTSKDVLMTGLLQALPDTVSEKEKCEEGYETASLQESQGTNSMVNSVQEIPNVKEKTSIAINSRNNSIVTSDQITIADSNSCIQDSAKRNTTASESKPSDLIDDNLKNVAIGSKSMEVVIDKTKEKELKTPKSASRGKVTENVSLLVDKQVLHTTASESKASDMIDDNLQNVALGNRSMEVVIDKSTDKELKTPKSASRRKVTENVSLLVDKQILHTTASESKSSDMVDNNLQNVALGSRSMEVAIDKPKDKELKTPKSASRRKVTENASLLVDKQLQNTNDKGLSVSESDSNKDVTKNLSAIHDKQHENTSDKELNILKSDLNQAKAQRISAIVDTKHQTFDKVIDANPMPEERSIVDSSTPPSDTAVQASLLPCVTKSVSDTIANRDRSSPTRFPSVVQDGSLKGGKTEDEQCRPEQSYDMSISATACRPEKNGAQSFEANNDETTQHSNQEVDAIERTKQLPETVESSADLKQSEPLIVNINRVKTASATLENTAEKSPLVVSNKESVEVIVCEDSSKIQMPKSSVSDHNELLTALPVSSARLVIPESDDDNNANELLNESSTFMLGDLSNDYDFVLGTIDDDVSEDYDTPSNLMDIDDLLVEDSGLLFFDDDDDKSNGKMRDNHQQKEISTPKDENMNVTESTAPVLADDGKPTTIIDPEEVENRKQKALQISNLLKNWGGNRKPQPEMPTVRRKVSRPTDNLESENDERKHSRSDGVRSSKDVTKTADKDRKAVAFSPALASTDELPSSGTRRSSRRKSRKSSSKSRLPKLPNGMTYVKVKRKKIPASMPKLLGGLALVENNETMKHLSKVEYGRRVWIEDQLTANQKEWEYYKNALHDTVTETNKIENLIRTSFLAFAEYAAALDLICRDVYVGSDGRPLTDVKRNELESTGYISISLRTSVVLKPIIQSFNKLKDELDHFVPLMEASFAQATSLTKEVLSTVDMFEAAGNALVEYSEAIHAEEKIQTTFGALMMASGNFVSKDQMHNSLEGNGESYQDRWLLEADYRNATRMGRLAWIKNRQAMQALLTEIIRFDDDRRNRLKEVLLSFLPRRRRFLLGAGEALCPVTNSLRQEISNRKKDDSIDGKAIDDAIEQLSRSKLKKDNMHSSTILNRSMAQSKDIWNDVKLSDIESKGEMNLVALGHDLSESAYVEERQIFEVLVENEWKLALGVFTRDHYLHVFITHFVTDESMFDFDGISSKAISQVLKAPNPDVTISLPACDVRSSFNTENEKTDPRKLMLIPKNEKNEGRFAALRRKKIIKNQSSQDMDENAANALTIRLRTKEEASLLCDTITSMNLKTGT